MKPIFTIILASLIHLPFLKHSLILEDHIFYKWAMRISYWDIPYVVLFDNEGQHFSPLWNGLLLFQFKITNGSLFAVHFINWVLLVGFGVTIYFFLNRFWMHSQNEKQEIPFWVHPPLVAAVIFVLHPLQLFTLHFVSASFVSAGGSLALLALMSMDRYDTDGQRRYLFAALCLALMAYGFSELLLLLPGYYFILRFMLRKDRFMRAMIGAIKLFIPSVVILAGWFLLAAKTTHLSGNIALFEFTLVEYLAQWSSLVFWCLSLLVFPFDPIFAKNISHHSSVSVGWVAFFILMVMSAAYFVFNKNFTRIFRGSILWIALGFVPTFLTCFVHAAAGLVYEPHWMTLAFIPVYFLFGHLVAKFYKRRGARRTGLLLVSVILYLSMLTFRETSFWQSEEAYFLRWQKISPGHHWPLLSLAHVYENKGEIEKSLGYMHLVRTTTGYPRHAINIKEGQILQRAGYLDKAAERFVQALREKPGDFNAQYGLEKTCEQMEPKTEVCR